MDEPTEGLEQLVEEARRGDVQAYGKLVGRTQGLVTAVVRSVIRDPHLAEDAVQETYLRAFRKLAALNEPRAFLTWLRRLAFGVAQNMVRGRHLAFVDVSVVADYPAASPPDPLISPEEEAVLGRALVHLSPDDRRLCERFYYGRWSAARLAENEGMSAAGVRKRLERIRKQLRKEIEMSQANGARNQTEWPDRIVRLLSRPVLTELPENPVGAIWNIVKSTHEKHKEVGVPETVTVTEVRSILGEDAPSHLPGIVHRIDDERILRWDLTLPMLLKSRELPADPLLMAAGRVYRDVEEDGRSLASFHQAEILLTGPNMNEWVMMGLITRWLDKLLPGSRVRVEEMSFELYCDRGWAVSVERNGEWEPLIGWGRIKNTIVGALGRDPEKIGAVGVGMGLERIACLKYGIDDLRKVESARV